MATVDEVVGKMSREQLRPYAVKAITQDIERARSYLAEVQSYIPVVLRERKNPNMGGHQEEEMESAQRDFESAVSNLKQLGISTEELDDQYHKMKELLK